jgi:hypothetical protein
VLADQLDPGRSLADLRHRGVDQAGLVHRRFEQVRKIAAGWGQEPARCLQRRHARPEPELQRQATRRATSRSRVIPACAQATKFARAALAATGTGPAGPEPTAG